MKIDILVPLHGAPLPQTHFSITQLIEFSRCKCAMHAIEEQIRNPNFKPDFHDTAKCPNGKHDIYWQPMANLSVVHWARNQLIISSRKDADYVLFWDADITTEPDTLERMLLHDVEIVAGLCTRRTDPAVPVHRYWMEEAQNYGEYVQWDETQPLMEVDAVGTGLMLIKTSLLRHMAEAFNPEQYAKNGNGWWFRFIRADHSGQEWGEDISFCWQAQRLGYKIYVDQTILPKHFDWYGYDLNDYRPYQKMRIEEILERQARTQ